jgi:hypothetical protein
MGILCRNITVALNGNIQPQNTEGNGNIILQAALKYNDKWMPKGATGDNGLPHCSHLLFYTLQDCGIWKDFKNANENCDRLSKDSRFVEIKYTNGEKGKPGDIMCIKRSSGSGHNMICTEVDENGLITKIIQSGSNSDPKGKNHVRISTNWCKKGQKDYPNLRVFRLKA